MRNWHEVDGLDPIYDQLYIEVLEARRRVKLYYGSRSKGVERVEKLTEELATALRALKKYTDQFDQI